MVKSTISFTSLSLFVISLLCSCFLNAQGNCLLYAADSGERQACELSYKALEYTQGSQASQMLFDSAIAIGPRYAWAYYEKSVPYFKRGLLNQGIQILNQAIALEPQNYLCYRAYWYFAHQSYFACIEDLEHYYNQLNGHIEYIPGGEIEMSFLLGLSYVKTGHLALGIRTIEERLNSYPSESYMGLYDHYVLGTLYYQNEQFELAQQAFEKQTTLNDRFADTYYYLGRLAEQNDNKAAAQAFYQNALNKFEGQEGGYSNSAFGTGVSKTDVEQAIVGNN